MITSVLRGSPQVQRVTSSDEHRLGNRGSQPGLAKPAAIVEPVSDTTRSRMPVQPNNAWASRVFSRAVERVSWRAGWVRRRAVDPACTKHRRPVGMRPAARTPARRCWAWRPTPQGVGQRPALAAPRRIWHM